MQLGSGTWDLQPALTYLFTGNTISAGAHALVDIPLGKNDNDYALGKRVHTTAFGAFEAASWLVLALRTDLHVWGDIEGADASLNPMMVATADPSLRAGKRLDVGADITLAAPSGALEGLKARLMISLPAYQNLDGPQLKQTFASGVSIDYVTELF
jgi:hypothetical protein